MEEIQPKQFNLESVINGSLRRAELHGADPKVAEGIGTVLGNLTSTVDMLAPKAGESINPIRQQKLLAFLEGLSLVTERVAIPNKKLMIPPENAAGLAAFIKMVNEIGVLNEDGSVKLNIPTTSHPEALSVTVPSEKIIDL